MDRNAFSQLLRRYVAGTATAEEKGLIDQCYEVLYNDSFKHLDEKELSVIEQEMWSHIRKEMAASDTKKPAYITSYLAISKWLVAAIIIGIVAGLALVVSLPSKTMYVRFKEQKGVIETANKSNETLIVSLEDGTVAELQPKARLAYPSKFLGDKREVYIDGEVFFKVAKNPSKPFFVHYENIIARVLGTSFSIKPDKITHQVVVEVRTGRVSVYKELKDANTQKAKTNNNGVIITPNQKVVYDNGTDKFVTALVEDPKIIPINERIIVEEPSFSFDDKPLSVVLDNIIKVYGVDIVVESENIYLCRFTGNISKQTLYEKLALICESTNHHYEIKGTKILLTGKGCY